MDASDRKQVREAKKAAKAADKQRKDVVRNLMSSIPGRAFVYEMLEDCHIWRSSAGILNGLAMAFGEGERNIGLKLLGHIMESCPDSYVLMLREYNERSASHDNRTSNSNTDGPGSGSEYPGGEDGDGRDQSGPNAPDPHGYYRSEGA